MITINQLDKCIQEAGRFIVKAQECKQRILKEDRGIFEPLIGGSRETGAVRRASLDLSRVLSDLRNSKFENK